MKMIKSDKKMFKKLCVTPTITDPKCRLTHIDENPKNIL